MTTLVDLVFRAKTESLDAASKKLDDLKGSAKGAEVGGTALGKAFAVAGPIIKGFALVATATVGTLAALASQSINAADKLSKLSTRTNIATERLSLLDKIAKMADSSAEELISSAERLAMKLSKQDENSGRAASALKDLGISAKDANGEFKSTVQLQEEIVAAADAAGNSAKAEGAAIQLLGTDYYKLRGAIRDVITNKTEMYAVMRDTGQLVTADLAKESATFNDHLSKMSGLFGGLGNSIAQATLPTLNKWLETANGWLRSMVTNIRELMGLAPKSVYIGKELDVLQQRRMNAQNTISKISGTPFAETGQGVRALAKAQADKEALDQQIRELTRARDAAVFGETTAMNDTLNGKKGEGNRVDGTTKPTKTPKTKLDGEGAMDAAAREYEEMMKRINSLIKNTPIEKTKEFQQDIALLDNAFASGRLSAEQHDQAIKQLTGTYADAEAATERENQRLEKLTEQYKLLADPMQKYRIQLAEVRELREKGLLTADQTLEAEFAINAAMQDAIDKGREHTSVLTEMQKFGQKVFSDISQSITHMITTGKSGFRDMSQSFIRGLLNMYIQAKIMLPLFTMLKAVTGWSWLSMPASANGNVFGPSGMLKSAKGNVFDKPTLHGYSGGIGMLGEAGPEAIMPLKRGANGKLGVVASGGGSQTNIINVTVEGGKDANETGDVVSKKILDVMRGVAKQEFQSQRRQAAYSV